MKVFNEKICINGREKFLFAYRKSYCIIRKDFHQFLKPLHISTKRERFSIIFGDSVAIYLGKKKICTPVFKHFIFLLK